MSILRPRTGTEMNCFMKPRWPSRDDRCAICGDYNGFHARCWWAWLAEEQVIRGSSDGEQQIEPDEPYPSRLVIAWRGLKTLLDPSWWKLCWDERMSPWPWGQ